MIAVVQARTSSSRLPGKVLLPVCGRPMLVRLLERVRRARSLARVVVATSRDPADDDVASLAARCGAEVHRGALDDVLDRVYHAAAEAGARHVVRLTGDCPLLDPQILDRVAAEHLRTGADYTSNTLVRTFPDGLDVEVMRFEVLAQAWTEARLPSEREHVTPFVTKRPERFRLHGVEHTADLSKLRWVVDRAVDLEIVDAVFARLLPDHPCFGMADVLALAAADPGLFARNAAIDPAEGWSLSLQRDARFLADEETE